MPNDFQRINYAIWSAVSSDRQAEDDKVSLAEQVNLARHRAKSKGWVETSGPYIAPGESRTRYVNLRDAEDAIPQLKALLDDAQARKFNLLVLYDYNRLRDLIDPVAKTLGAYGVQIYSVNQPVEPVDPLEYNQYASDSESIMRGIAQILTRAQISDLHRKYAYSMPKRVLERGLPHIVPYGYIHVSSDKPPEIDPYTSPAMILAKDMILAGQSLRQVTERLTADGYPPPGGDTWYPESIRRLLKNPFYAGIVHWANSQVINDPRTGKSKRVRTPERQITAQGLHTPLWSEAEHYALLHDLRRVRSYRGRSANQFSSLLICGSCGKRMGITYAGGLTSATDKTKRIKIRNVDLGTYRCRRHEATCVSVKHPELVRLVTDALIRILNETGPVVALDNSLDETLMQLVEQRGRINDAFVAGAFTLDEMMNLKRPIDGKIVQVEAQIKSQAARQSELSNREAALEYIKANLDDLRMMIADNSVAQKTNHLLRKIVKKITVYADRVEIDAL